MNDKNKQLLLKIYVVLLFVVTYAGIYVIIMQESLVHNQTVQLDQLQKELNASRDAYARLSCLNQSSGICYQDNPIKYNGMAYGSTCFAVYTKGRTYADIMETCNHEYMHTNGHMKDEEK